MKFRGKQVKVFSSQGVWGFGNSVILYRVPIGGRLQCGTACKVSKQDRDGVISQLASYIDYQLQRENLPNLWSSKFDFLNNSETNQTIKGSNNGRV